MRCVEGLGRGVYYTYSTELVSISRSYRLLGVRVVLVHKGLGLFVGSGGGGWSCGGGGDLWIDGKFYDNYYYANELWGGVKIWMR